MEKLFFIKQGIFRLQKRVEDETDYFVTSVGVKNWNSTRGNEDDLSDTNPKSKIEWDNQLLECKN